MTDVCIDCMAKPSLAVAWRAACVAAFIKITYKVGFTVHTGTKLRRYISLNRLKKERVVNNLKLKIFSKTIKTCVFRQPDY